MSAEGNNRRKKINRDYFIAVFPDQKASSGIKQVLAQVGQLFDNHNIPINLVHPDTFHVTVFILGKKFSWIDQQLLSKKLKKCALPRFTLRLDKVRLGISRNNRELLFLTVEEGAEDLRNLVYELSPKLKLKRDYKFVPHLSLGRVSKDLTDEEFRNLNDSIQMLNQSLRNTNIEFDVDHYKLVVSENGDYSFLKSFIAR